MLYIRGRNSYDASKAGMACNKYVYRETPLSEIHLRNMLEVTRAGAVIFPPIPAFYIKAGGIEELIDQNVGRMLDLFGLDTQGFERWNGWEK